MLYRIFVRINDRDLSYSSLRRPSLSLVASSDKLSISTLLYLSLPCLILNYLLPCSFTCLHLFSPLSSSFHPSRPPPTPRYLFPPLPTSSHPILPLPTLDYLFPPLYHRHDARTLPCHQCRGVYLQRTHSKQVRHQQSEYRVSHLIVSLCVYVYIYIC